MNEQIVRIFEDFGENLSGDLKDSAILALKQAGRKSPQDIKLDFNSEISYSDTTVEVVIRAVNGERGVAYWKNIEEGRRAGAKRLPADVVGKKWQNENNIDARKILLEIRNKKLKKPGKSINMDYQKAAKSLSFIIQRAIFKRGIRPKPYVDRVLNDGRIAAFREQLTPILGAHFKLVIKDLT